MLYINQYQALKNELIRIRGFEIIDQIKKSDYNRGKVEKRMVGDMIAVTGVRLNERGEIMTSLLNEKEEIRNYPMAQYLFAVCSYKRLFLLLVKSLSKQNWFKRIVIILALKSNYPVFIQWLDYIFFQSGCLVKEENYSQVVKEVRRVLDGKIDDAILNAISMILEWDSAYRYRFQDIAGELNKNNVLNDEVFRLVSLLAERETDSGMKDKAKSIKKFIKLFFFIKPSIKKIIQMVINEINLDEVKLSKEDIYWTNKGGCYSYRGLSIKERQAENIKNYGKV